MRKSKIWVPEAPNLITRPTKELTVKSTMGFVGIFGFEVSTRAGIVKQQGEFPNLITDAGLDAIGDTSSQTGLMNFVGVGTGSSTPTHGDVELDNQVGPRINNTGGFSEETGYVNADPANPYWVRRRVRVYDFGAFGGSGVNLTEIGMFHQSTGGIMWSRQLFRDTAGNPITVTVLPDEQLKVWYEFRLYPPMDQTTQTISVNGVSTTITNGAQGVAGNLNWGFQSSSGRSGMALGFSSGAHFAWVGETNIPPSTPVNTISTAWMVGRSSQSIQAYVSGSLQRDCIFIWNPAVANFDTGVGCLNWSNNTGGFSNYTHYSVFDPKIPKGAEDRLTINYRISWNRIPLPAGHG